MKKTLRVLITGTVQNLFFNKFVFDQAQKNEVRGFLRYLDDGRIEIFIEGNYDSVDKMTESCTNGPKYTDIRSFEIKEEKFQDFKEFKILNF